MEHLTPIEEDLFKQQDIPYRALQKKLIPTVNKIEALAPKMAAMLQFALNTYTKASNYRQSELGVSNKLFSTD